MNEIEIPLSYPREWEDEYKRNYPDFPRVWRDDYPELFDGTCDGSGVRLKNTGGPSGTLSEFCDYALMYLLRRDQGWCSLTYYQLGSSDYSKKVGPRRKCRQDTMRRWMGDANFESLQAALRPVMTHDFKGEPDLFCWNPGTGAWFFAEAKGVGDRLRDSQREWFRVCRETLPQVEIRVYRLCPEPLTG